MTRRPAMLLVSRQTCTQIKDAEMRAIRSDDTFDEVKWRASMAEILGQRMADALYGRYSGIGVQVHVVGEAPWDDTWKHRCFSCFSLLYPPAVPAVIAIQVT